MTEILAEKKSLAVYHKLVQDISSLYEGARKTLVTSYWQIGRRIVEVEQGGELRAHYGDHLLQKLSGDLSRKYGAGFSVTNLKRVRQFFVSNPKSPPADQLTWAQQIELLPVRNSKQCLMLKKRVERQGLNRDQVRELVHKKSGAGKSTSLKTQGSKLTTTLLTPIRGKLFTYQIVKKGGALYLDRGFRNYQQLTGAQTAHYKEGDVVEEKVTKGYGKLQKVASGSVENSRTQKKTEKQPLVTSSNLLVTTRNPLLYTYEAKLDRVYDGDTQRYFIFTDRQGARGMRNDKLRLRGIDCPEMKTSAGKAAKKFVEALFSKAQTIQVTTTKPDKFDRYLSDIFLQMKDGSEIFLNNELLQAGHARLYSDPKPEDWEQ